MVIHHLGTIRKYPFVNKIHPHIMKKLLILPVGLALLLAAGCKKDSLQNTVWLHTDLMYNSDSTEILVRDSTRLDFIDDESGRYKHVHVTDRATSTDRAVFFYTIENGHGTYSVNDTYEFDVKGSTMEVHKKNVPSSDPLINVPFSDTLIYNLIYSEK